MIRRMLTMLMLVLGVSAAQAAERPDPGAFIQQLTEQLASELEKNRDTFARDHRALKAFAEQKVLPHVAAEKMARYALGKYWRSASEAQRERFVAAFRDMLLRSYANTLLKMKITRLKVERTVPGKRGRWQVEQTVTREGAPETKVVYRLYWDRKANRWKIYDVVAENVSLLLNYRKVFASELQKKGLDRVIEEMEQRNRDFLEGKGEAEEAKAA